MLYVDPTYDTIDLEQWEVIQLPKQTKFDMEIEIKIGLFAYDMYAVRDYCYKRCSGYKYLLEYDGWSQGAWSYVPYYDVGLLSFGACVDDGYCFGLWLDTYIFTNDYG